MTEKPAADRLLIRQTQVKPNPSPVPFIPGMNVIKNLADPRYYQIVVLSSLLVFGVFILGFGIHWQNALAIIVTAQIVQFLCMRLAGVAPFDPLSAAITSLSLTLLLRTDLIAIAIVAACIAIGSKFVLRVGGKHIFNPANVALVTLMFCSNDAWVSSGQWGSAAIGAFTLACLGFLVLTRAKRAETTLAFLVAYAALMTARALWLGDPMSIPLHQLQNGALLIFAFFMISDPKTTPNRSSTRILYGVLVASVAYVIQFVFYEPNAPIIALILSAPLVPVLDWLMRGQNYRWNRPAAARIGNFKGV